MTWKSYLLGVLVEGDLLVKSGLLLCPSGTGPG